MSEEEFLKRNNYLMSHGHLPYDTTTCETWGLSGNCGKNCPNFKNKTCDVYVDVLERINQELKKQLEELEKENLNLREYIMTNKMAIPYEEIKDKSLYDLYTIPSYSDLSKENQELKKQLKIKHNGFMASVDESCDLAKENQKYKEVIDKAIMYVNSTRYSDINGLQKYSIKEFWFIKELEYILNEVE